jgi:hypothetical protein
MGCLSQGLYYVKDYVRPKLICQYPDENGIFQEQFIQHWQESHDDNNTCPFPSLFPPIFTGGVYSITSYFAIKDDDFEHPWV